MPQRRTQSVFLSLPRRITFAAQHWHGIADIRFHFERISR
jgi:hypothetical protein